MVGKFEFAHAVRCNVAYRVSESRGVIEVSEAMSIVVLAFVEHVNKHSGSQGQYGNEVDRVD